MPRDISTKYYSGKITNRKKGGKWKMKPDVWIES